ncbi:hypothetical protein ACIRP7_20890 [Streptomyces sp. NPDC102270]|uniref:hypothetical protein n=1 Tax=Streptomyces sp. NPDC102270 TaxID=3366150 RepID=UPI0037FF5FFC
MSKNSVPVREDGHNLDPGRMPVGLAPAPRTLVPAVTAHRPSSDHCIGSSTSDRRTT